MNIPKAIEILTLLDKGCDPDECQDSKDAIKLGIEALKRLDDIRNHRQLYIYALLPGETPEEEVESDQRKR